MRTSTAVALLALLACATASSASDELSELNELLSDLNGANADTTEDLDEAQEPHAEAVKVEKLLKSLLERLESEEGSKMAAEIRAERDLARITPEKAMVKKLLVMVRELNGKETGSRNNPAVMCKDVNKNQKAWINFGLDKEIQTYCKGKWTMVASLYDTAGDDFPNDPRMVESGFQQTGNGQWSKNVNVVQHSSDRSSNMGLDFIKKLFDAKKAKDIMWCFASNDGTDQICRDTKSGSLTLGSYNTGNPRLKTHASQPFVYTYGRITGLFGSHDGYNPGKISGGKYCIKRSAGGRGNFGDSGHGDCEHTSGCWVGIWHGWGHGMSYRPWKTDGDELGACSGYNKFNSFHVYVQ